MASGDGDVIPLRALVRGEPVTGLPPRGLLADVRLHLGGTEGDPLGKKETPSALLSAEAAVWVRVALTFDDLDEWWVLVDRGVA